MSDHKQRSLTAVGNFNFIVQIQADGASADAAPILVLELPVDAVRGLGDARTTVMRHRTFGTKEAVSTPFPGLSSPDAVTLEGSYLFDAKDVIALQKWHGEVKGTEPTTLNGYRRQVNIIPTSSYDSSTDAASDTVLGKTIQLSKCICTRLSFSDFDINAPAVSSWSIEIEFEDMKVI